MMLRVWCCKLNQLTKQPVAVAVDVDVSDLDGSGRCVVDDLRLRILFDPPTAFTQAREKRPGAHIHVHVYANTSAKKPLPLDAPLGGRGRHQHDPLALQPLDDLDAPFFHRPIKLKHRRPRVKLLRRLIKMVSTSQFTFVEAHAHTGKSTLKSPIPSWGGGQPHLLSSA